MLVYSLATTSNNIANLRDELNVCSEIESLSVNGHEETGVTSFVQEACTSVSAPDGSYAVMEKSAELQNLNSYLSRPVSLSRSTIPTNRSVMYSREVTALSSIFPRFSDRVLGAYGMRYTMVFTLQVAATPFHQGVLAIAFQYGETMLNNVVGSIDRFTNLPHVRLDLSSETMVQLRVPFLYTHEFMPIAIATGGPYGTVGISNLTRIPSVEGMGPPTYHLFVHLEDLEFFGASPMSLTAVSLQSGLRKEFKTESHPFSNVVGAVGRTLSAISKVVPVPSLSTISGSTGWFLEATAGALRAFGWARPQIVDPMHKMWPVNNVGEFNQDVASASQVVGPMASNSLRHSIAFSGTDVDEMSIGFVTSRPSQVCLVDLPDTLAAGSLVYACPISPAAMYMAVLPPTRANSFLRYRGLGAPQSFAPTSLFFASQLFKFWRGSMVFRFTFAKTKLHAGRVIVTFTPFFDAESTVGRASRSSTLLPIPQYSPSVDPFGHTAIFNLKDDNVFEFTVPYVAPVPYCSFSDFTGSISMHVLEPLVGPTNAASVVDVLVEVRGGDDFELANPRNPMFTPYERVELQSGIKVRNDCEYTMGERLLSLKQLLGIPALYERQTSSADTNVKTLLPHWASTTTAHSDPVYTVGIPSYIARAYAFVKGSTDVHVYVHGSDKNIMSIHQQVDVNLTSRIADPFLDASQIRVQSTVGKSLHARLPAYQQLVRLSTTSCTAVWPPLHGGPTSFYTLEVSTADKNDITTYVCAGDDAFACMYIGPPQLFNDSHVFDGAIVQGANLEKESV